MWWFSCQSQLELKGIHPYKHGWCKHDCRALIFVPITHWGFSSLAFSWAPSGSRASGWNVSLLSAVVKQPSLEFWETISFIYQNLSWLWKSWKTKISATFFLCLLPFIFLTLLGLANVEEKRQTRKEPEEPKEVLMRELLWEKKNIKTKLKTIHIPTSALLKHWEFKEFSRWSRRVGRLQMGETTLSVERRTIKTRKSTRSLQVQIYQKVFKWTKKMSSGVFYLFNYGGFYVPGCVGVSHLVRQCVSSCTSTSLWKTEAAETVVGCVKRRGQLSFWNMLVLISVTRANRVMNQHKAQESPDSAAASCTSTCA